MMVTNHMKEKLLNDIRDKKKKGLHSKEILKLYCVRFGIPEDIALAIHTVIYNEGYDAGHEAHAKEQK